MRALRMAIAGYAAAWQESVYVYGPTVTAIGMFLSTVARVTRRRA